MTTQIQDLDELYNYLGKHLGYSEWHQVNQDQIDKFAEATGDYQWIHVDPEAARQGPFGSTIAHGYLTLSLVSALLPEVLSITGIGIAVNYGANKIRFPSPVLSGTKIRLGGQLSEIVDFSGGTQITVVVTIEAENSNKPSLVAELIFRYYK